MRIHFRHLMLYEFRKGSSVTISPKCTVRTDAAVEAVRQSVLEDPFASTCRRFTQLGIARTSLQKILKLNLKMFSYKIQMVQALLPQDTQQRLQLRFAQFYLLQEIFGERIISKYAEFVWLPRSSNLMSPDFFLWGYLKEQVYVNKPRTIQELKENIRAEIRRLGLETLRTVVENAAERACICEQENGGHLRDVVSHI
ncbi:hypothetical protein WH47_04903 [Habropoda laboriosa]|uniref:DUF4817 domain-containing protein n=1 Tax=Habropoda laboriosa TaxID=597456 RepID=A0A0L7QWY4_9HYME|nr:hypothetical protein WH47_04903 [Habropoda laboriosa]